MLNPREVKTNADARTIVEQRGLSHIKVGLFDIDGILRGKYMSREKFFSALDKGFGFCDVVLGWDSNDRLYENTRVTYTGWHTGYPDAPTRIVADSCRDLPMEEGGLFFLAEFDQQAAAICPRHLLKRVIDRCASMGLVPRAALEYEFFLFDETPQSVREKNYQNLQPITPGFFGYSVLRNSVQAESYQELLALCEQMDFPLEGLHAETGPGVWEAAITHDLALAAADKAALFKTFTKVWAQRNHWMATFMSRWSPDYHGQSGHIHLALFNADDGSSCFYDSSDAHGMSEMQRQFVAGQLQLMPELLVMLAQTVNSYSRLVPGFWAPTASSWGVENRTNAVRVIPGSASSQRVEHRLGSADANPYIALAAALAAGLWGIEKQLSLPAAVEGNAYEQEVAPQDRLPADLMAAASRLRSSEAATELFGAEFVNHFAASREWEHQQYQRHISDWELQRYLKLSK